MDFHGEIAWNLPWKSGSSTCSNRLCGGDEWPDAVPQALAQLGAAEQLTPLLEFLQARMGQMGQMPYEFPMVWGSLYWDWVDDDLVKMMICRLVVDIILNILGISTIHAYFLCLKMECMTWSYKHADMEWVFNEDVTSTLVIRVWLRMEY